jgi:hypothetical protein
MAITEGTNFKGVTKVGDTLLMSELENNLKAFFNWSLLGIGAFVNIEIPSTGAYGGNYHTLKPVHDPAYTDGQVWQTIRKDWVWETGISYTGATPINVTGIVVDGTPVGTGTAFFLHYYNYPLGRVIFTGTPPVTTSTITMRYSYRWAQVDVIDNLPWIKEVQPDSFRTDDSHWTTTSFSGGNWSIGGHQRVQLPAVAIEAVPRRNASPWELGNSSLVIEQDILFHILAEKRWDRNQLLDIIGLQEDKIIQLYDSNSINDAGAWPLTYKGMRVSSPKMYPTLVSTYPFQTARFKSITFSEVETINPYLYKGVARATMEVIYG